MDKLMRFRGPKASIGLCAILFGVCLPGVVAAEAGETEGRQQTVVLGVGRIGKDHWKVQLEATRASEKEGSGAVCFLLAIGGIELASCPQRTVGTRPLVQTLSARVGKGKHIVVAMLFPANAKQMILKLHGQHSATILLNPISLGKTDPVNAVSFSSFAHGYVNRFCIDRITALDAEGGRIGQLGRQPCV